MTAISKPQLDRVDLSGSSCHTLAALVGLLTPHVPYSLHILGAVLNTSTRSSTLQDVDSSKVSLWSTIPIHSDTVSTTDIHGLFSIVTFSHLDQQFRFFCSGESRPLSDSPTEAEERHVKQVFEHLLDIAREAHPRYDSILTSLGSAPTLRNGNSNPPMILIGAVHAKWSRILAPMTTRQSAITRYAFPHDSLPLAAMSPAGRRQLGGDDLDREWEWEVSEIQASDVSFVDGASSIPRTEAYILSRAPCSVCLRAREPDGARRPVACALMHCDGSIGALRVDPTYRRRGLGTWVLCALVERLDFSGNSQVISGSALRDLGGGALGWNWVDTGASNEAGHRFFAPLVRKEDVWTCHWSYMLVHPHERISPLT